MYYFLFVTFLSKLSRFHARKPNILEIRYIAVQYSADVFICFLLLGCVFFETVTWRLVFILWINKQPMETQWKSDSATKPTTSP